MRPDPELLGSGDILAPAVLPNGEWQMVRVVPGEGRYNYWLREIQSKRNRPAPRDEPASAPVAGIIVGLLLPIVGVVWAIVLFAQGHGTHGGAVLLSSFFGWLVAIALIF